MKLLVAFFGLVALGLCGGAASSVRSLTAATFDSTVQESAMLVKFFAPWCGHCKALAPEYQKVAEMFESSKKVAIAEVDCDSEQNKPLCAKHGVTGYPTLKFFPKGQTTSDVKYEGPRTADDIARFVGDKTGERVRAAVKHYVELTPETFDTVVMDPEQNVLVAFYAPWCGHCQKLSPEFEKAAASFQPTDKVILAKVDADKYRDIGGKFEVSGFPTIKFFAAGSAAKTPVEYAGGREAKDIVEYMNAHSNAERVLGGGLKPEAGRVAAMDELAAKFKLATNDVDRQAVLEEAKAKVPTLPEKDNWSANTYVKVMEMALKRGASYPAQETARLQKILDGKAVAANKVDEFTKRVHILAAF